jgi:hypothetical protein
MARARNESPEPDHDTLMDAPESEPAPSEPRGPDDVLCYVDRLGALATIWNEMPKDAAKVGGVVIPSTHRVRLEPGLSFCPGAHWQAVKASPAWTQRAALGAIRAVAGQGGDLQAEWARAKTAVLVAMLAKTYHIPALERLREMENALPRPRPEVAQEIDSRLAEMGEKVAQHREQRRGQRRAHRRQVLG